jgi:hypothetical protein
MVHFCALQHTVPTHDSEPEQPTVQSAVVAPQLTRPVHDVEPPHVTSHVCVAVHVTPAAHELDPPQFTVQLVPPHATLPEHALGFEQSIVHALAFVQSTPPAQPFNPHVT